MSSLSGSARRAVGYLPPVQQQALRRLLHGARRLAAPAPWEALRRTAPVNDRHGLDRGTPVDRVGIEGFLQRHAADVCGQVLEVGDLRYAESIGGECVSEAHVLDVPRWNPTADILADLGEPGSLPPERYDCFLLIQTLQYVGDLDVAIANAWSTLRPGGVLLVTVPCLSRLDPICGSAERWRVTPTGLQELLLRAFPADRIHVSGYGNVLTAVAFLHGLAAEDLDVSELAYNDPEFPLVACGRARKPGIPI